MTGSIIIIIALVIIECLLVWRYIVRRRIEKNSESQIKFEISDNIRVQSGHFMVFNTLAGENEYQNVTCQSLTDETCYISDSDPYYHIDAKCLVGAYKDYRFHHEITYKLVKIENAELLGKRLCSTCVYNDLLYRERMYYELQGREYKETTLIGNGTAAIQEFLDFYYDNYELAHISDSRIFFDYLENGRISASVLCHYNKDEDKEYSIYDVIGHKEKIGYISSSFIKQSGIEKDSFESLTGLLKEITIGEDNKLGCDIIVFFDGNELTGIESFMKEKVRK